MIRECAYLTVKDQDHNRVHRERLSCANPDGDEIACQSPSVNRKKAGQLFRGPPVPATLEGGKNQSGDPAGLARIDARVRGNGSATGARVIADRDGVPPRVPVRQHPKRSSLRLSPNDEMVANEEGLRCGQLAEPMYRVENTIARRDPIPPFSVVTNT